MMSALGYLLLACLLCAAIDWVDEQIHPQNHMQKREHIYPKTWKQE